MAETGSTFWENATLKLQACLETSLPQEVDFAIAEDSGLVIDALDGFPGIRSDRWTYADKNQGILELMTGQTNRNARYEACLACWSKTTGLISHYTGTVELKVAEAPQGENGFGYDPIMIPAALDTTRTMAQLSPEEKNRISHRFNALSRFWTANAPAKPIASDYCASPGHDPDDIG